MLHLHSHLWIVIRTNVWVISQIWSALTFMMSCIICRTHYRSQKTVFLNMLSSFSLTLCMLLRHTVDRIHSYVCDFYSSLQTCCMRSVLMFSSTRSQRSIWILRWLLNKMLMLFLVHGWNCILKRLLIDGERTCLQAMRLQSSYQMNTENLSSAT